MIMFFTLQASDSSRDLSKAVRSWLRCFGVDVVFKRLQRKTDYCEGIRRGILTISDTKPIPGQKNVERQRLLITRMDV